MHKLSFADHVSKEIGSPIEQTNTVYATGKFTLEKADKLLTHIVQETNKERKLLIFDAVHDLYTYYTEAQIISFLDHIIDRARILQLNPVFLFDRRKVTTRLVKRLDMISDGIIKI